MKTKEIYTMNSIYKIHYSNMNICFLNGKSLSLSEMIHIIEKYKPNKVIYEGITNIEQLNDLIILLSSASFNIKTEIKLTSDEPHNIPAINGLFNKRVLLVDKLPKNVKISAFNGLNQTEFTTWCHNMKESDKESLICSLKDDEKDLFISQEKLIGDISKEIIENNPEIFSQHKINQVKIIYDYILNMNSDKDKANLFTLVSNSNYFKLNVTTVYNNESKFNYYVNNNEILLFDMENGIKGESIRKVDDKYKEGRVYPTIKKITSFNKSNKVIKKLTF